MYCIPHIGYKYHTISWDGVYCIPKMGMLGVSREITPFWYEIHTFCFNCVQLVKRVMNGKYSVTLLFLHDALRN